MEALKNLVGKSDSNKNEGGRGLASGVYNDNKSTSETSSSTPQTTSREDKNEGGRGLATGAYNDEHYETSDNRVAPAVQHERVRGMTEERTQAVVDRDEHVDHYHTTVQPVAQRQVDPTVHQQQQASTQYREFEHDDAEKTNAALAAQAAQFKSTREIGDVAQTRTTLDPVERESVHHHMHETVQPVIKKETIQPTVIDTTVPIHEVHHGRSHIHDTTVAPTMGMDEFTKTQTSEESRRD